MFWIRLDADVEIKPKNAYYYVIKSDISIAIL